MYIYLYIQYMYMCYMQSICLNGVIFYMEEDKDGGVVIVDVGSLDVDIKSSNGLMALRRCLLLRVFFA